MCDGIGLSRNQRDWHIKKIREDKVLSKGAENFPSPTNGDPQDLLCLKLDSVPLWLAKYNKDQSFFKESEISVPMIKLVVKAPEKMDGHKLLHGSVRKTDKNQST